MLKGIQIMRVGLTIFVIALVMNHTIELFREFTAFFSGVGCSISIVGAGKQFVEMYSKARKTETSARL